VTHNCDSLLSWHSGPFELLSSGIVIPRSAGQSRTSSEKIRNPVRRSVMSSDPSSCSLEVRADVTTTAVHPLTPPPAPPIGPSMSDHSATRDNCASGSRVARPATAARATVAGPRFVQKSLYPCQPNLTRDFLRLRRLRRLRLRKILTRWYEPQARRIPLFGDPGLKHFEGEVWESCV
jgi:hypothetical protein